MTFLRESLKKFQKEAIKIFGEDPGRIITGISYGILGIPEAILEEMPARIFDEISEVIQRHFC